MPFYVPKLNPIKLMEACASFRGDPATRNRIEVDHNTSFPGLRRPGNVYLEGVRDSFVHRLGHAVTSGKTETFTIDIGDGQVMQFEGYVTDFCNKGSVDGFANWTATIRPTGKPELVKEKQMNRNIPKAIPEGLLGYYVGSNNLTPDWTKATEKEAVAHATKLIDADGYESVFVVKIVKVVRKKQAPVAVETFKAPKVKKTRG